MSDIETELTSESHTDKTEIDIVADRQKVT